MVQTVCVDMFETSDVMELSPMFSKSCFSELLVSQTLVASHSSQLILYIGQTTLSFPTGSFGCTNNCPGVFVDLKEVSTPNPPNTLLSSYVAADESS